MARQKARLAVLFADVSDSTRLYDALGDTAAFGTVRGCLEQLRAVAQAFGGRVVKTIGDGAMCVFPSADAAAQAACEMQQCIARQPPAGDKAKLSIRVGFHYGLVIEEGEDVFGDCVNVAARMSGIAAAGQVITTGETVAALSPHLREATRRLDALPVKGKGEEVDVHELMWHAAPDRTVIPGRVGPVSVPSAGPCIRLLHRGRELSFKGTVYLGRDDSNTVIVSDPMASRRHAKIELRADKFVLVDQSTNGTFVRIGADPEIRLRREELILHGSGVIAFGHSVAETSAETIEFRCESK
ncbi:MAG TPA: adenylate/guanylate cyclase domain-containing protein [Burkholderiales bacterium]|nr:adenylate/guanylate cyclase domain-containing protein [Burkholderiales bacterium]